jgi:gliding motility associated protien GldN
MRKFIIFCISIALFFSFNAYAQDDTLNDNQVDVSSQQNSASTQNEIIIENANEEEEEEEAEEVQYLVPRTTFIKRALVKEKKPLEYAEVSEENVMWSEIVWRFIDSRERINNHLYYPTEEMNNRKSLAQALIHGIRTKKILAYDDEEFKTRIGYSQIMERMDAKEKEIREEKMDGSGDTVFVRKEPVDWKQIREFYIKEEWFFDKKHSRMNVRIIGICPIRVFSKKLNTGEDDENAVSGEEVRSALFWVYFPEARRVLANNICFTGKNQTANISFDDVFYKRYFSSKIIRVSNASNDRRIEDYTANGWESVMESERIKNELLKMESDFWSF